MPVLDSFVDCDHITGLQQLGGLTLFLVPAFARRDQQNLEAVVVDVPVVPATRFEIDIRHVNIDVIVW